MTTSVKWTTLALQDLEDIQDYIAERNPPAAFELAEQIRGQIHERLADYPLSGRAGRVDGTRELVVSGTAYVVAYRVQNEGVEILAIKHGAQEWPKVFE